MPRARAYQLLFHLRKLLIVYFLTDSSAGGLLSRTVLNMNSENFEGRFFVLRNEDLRSKGAKKIGW